jgi:hypothetical protein
VSGKRPGCRRGDAVTNFRYLVLVSTHLIFVKKEFGEKGKRNSRRKRRL